MKPKLIIVDVDGIMTDGTKLYMHGKPAGKMFYDRDFTAIKYLHTKGILVCFLSADDANEQMASDRGIVYFNARDEHGRIAKGAVTRRILEYTGVAKEEAWCLGDDIFDVAMFKECARSFCPANAARYVKEHATDFLSESNRPWLWYLAESYIENLVPDDVIKIIERDAYETRNSFTR